MNVSVIGNGKLGAPLSAWFASAGHTVYCLDASPSVVQSINRGVPPVNETGLDDLFKKHDKRMLGVDMHMAESVLSISDFIFLIVPTPSMADGSFDNKYILAALEPVARAIEAGAHPCVVIVSTVSPMSMDEVIIPFLERHSGRQNGIGFDVAYSPEFIALGSILENMNHPDYILIGARNASAAAGLVKFYEDLHTTLGNPVPPVVIIPIIDAEIAKLSNNVFSVMKIGFANSLAEYCERIPGANARNVCQAIGNDKRIGSKYLQPATKASGPCFPRDCRAMIAATKSVGIEHLLAMAADTVNNLQTQRIVDLVCKIAKKKVSILGLTYKPYTSVTEESAGMEIVDALCTMLPKTVAIECHDPEARCTLPSRAARATYIGAALDADVVVIATPWPLYKMLSPKDFSPGATVIDCWGILDRKAFAGTGVDLWSIGVGPELTVPNINRNPS